MNVERYTSIKSYKLSIREKALAFLEVRFFFREKEQRYIFLRPSECEYLVLRHSYILLSRIACLAFTSISIA